MTSPPSYAHVFPCQLPRPPLLKLDDRASLSKLHAKFWNRSIDEDESTWARAHDQLMDTDESDIVRGCFPLEINIDNFRISKLWFRKDYIRIYDRCNSH